MASIDDVRRYVNQIPYNVASSELDSAPPPDELNDYPQTKLEQIQNWLKDNSPTKSFGEGAADSLNYIPGVSAANLIDRSTTRGEAPTPLESVGAAANMLPMEGAVSKLSPGVKSLLADTQGSVPAIDPMVLRYQRMLEAADAKGLDLSPEARIARAKEQGYMTGDKVLSMASKKNVPINDAYDNLFNDEPEDLFKLYHGTSDDLSAFNPNYLGLQTNAVSARHGTFLSNLPEDADFYARGNEDGINGKMNRSQDIMWRLRDQIEQQQKHLDLYDKYGESSGIKDDFRREGESRLNRLQDRLHQMTATNYTAAPNIIPAYVRSENPAFVNMKGDGYGTISKNLVSAKSKGNDAVIFHNITDPNRGATHVAVFDPSRIRSVNAIFDPDKINSRNILASVGGAAALNYMPIDDAMDTLDKLKSKYK